MDKEMTPANGGGAVTGYGKTDREKLEAKLRQDESVLPASGSRCFTDRELSWLQFNLRVLNEAGIITLHDETLHDSPSYTESYARSAETAKAYLAQYPSIKIILDVHRDALGDETTRIKPLCTLEGQNTAQIMLIAGCDNGGSVSLPRWRENLAFAAAWEAQMEGAFPGLTRPVLCGYRFYNQDLTTGSLLVEVGGHGNTLEEALSSGEYAAQALAALLFQ